MSFSKKITNLKREVLKESEPLFAHIEDVAEANTLKVLDAMRECRVSDAHFNTTTGYAYDDIGRGKLEELYAKIFGAERALVRTQFVSGTHALATVLFGILRPGDELVSLTGKPYDTMQTVIGYDNPSPGNKQGGITTLEDKSCGCVQKGGSAPIMDVIDYGEPVTTKGLNMLYGPGNDLVSATALTAAGAHMVLFSTGRGTPFGAPAPTLKIATNSQLAARKKTWIDFNAGVVADGERTLDEAGADLYQLVLDVASGKQTCAEKKGFREISIFKDGVVL